MVLEGTATILGEANAVFSGAPIAPAPSDVVARWASDTLGDGGLELGELVHAPGVRADPHGLARHTFLVGQSGSGKTYTTGVLLEQIAQQTSLRLVVLDPNSDHVGLRQLADLLLAVSWHSSLLTEPQG